MAGYYYEGEKAEQLPEKFVVEHRLIGDENELRKAVSNYLRQTVAKILLAKNKALSADGTKKLVEEMRERAYEAGDEVKLQENYLENLVIKNKQGDVITSAEEMEKWVDDTFYFALSDIDQPNAWIMAQDEEKPQKSVMAVTTKILEKADNAAQFEGIIAHELGHYFVQRRYGQERAQKAGAINEKMADMHALDCLVYMGKNPEEYTIAFSNLVGDSNKDMDPIERIIVSIQDEHGGDVSRTQDMSDYVTAKYENTVADFYEKEANGEISKSDDIAFARFKQNIKSVYLQERFMSYVEQQFAMDEKFAAAIEPQSGRINFSKLKYEDVLDKLIEIGKNQGFRHYPELSDAAEMLARSSKEGLQITPELSQKATLLMTVAADSCFMNKLYTENKARDKYYQEKMEENIAVVLSKHEKGENYLNTIENKVIIEEFERLGRAPTPKEVGEKLMLIPEIESLSDKPFMYNGKEVYRTLQTIHFKEAVRSEKQKESDFRRPNGAHFHLGDEKAADQYLCDAIYQEAYLRDGTRLTPMEVAEKLDEVLADVPGGLSNETVEYNGKNLYINTYDVKRFLQIYKPQSALLSDQDRLERFDSFGISSDDFWTLRSGADKDAVDELQMAVCYPEIDFISFKNQMSQCVREEDQENLQKELSAQVMAANVVRVEPYSFMRKDAESVQQFLDGNGGNLDVTLKGYARFAVNMPTFEMPREEDAAGKELPWLNCDTEALRYGHINLGVGDGKSKTEATAADYNIQTPENLFQKNNIFHSGLSMLVKFPDGKAYDFLADENGRITITGAKVAELKKEEARQATENTARQISENFRERVKVLDALICVAEVQQKEKQGTVSAEDAAKRTEALAFLCATENLETKMFQLKNFRYGQEYDTSARRQKELAYHNMPAAQEQLIAEDMAFLRQSEFFKRFAGDKELPQNPEDITKYIENMLQWNVEEKTPDLLQTIIPPMYSVMGVRMQKLESTQKKFAGMGTVEADLVRNLEMCATDKNLGADAKRQVNGLILALKLRTVQEAEVMYDLKKIQMFQFGTEGDEVLYTQQLVPYYEKMRRIMNLPETDGAPEQLYQNLAATYKENEVIKNEEQREQLISDYKYILTSERTDNLDTLRQSLTEQNKCLLDEGTRKLAFPMTDSYKMAEYEVARYMTNPANPPLDAVKLLQAYPKFEADVSSQSYNKTAEFQDLVAAYILERGGFKDKDFYGKKEIFDLMAHKGLFNGETETRAVFAEELKKAYEKLPEAEKEKAALSMLQDNVLEYESYAKDFGRYGVARRQMKESTISSVDNLIPIKQYFTEQFAEKFVARMGKEPVIGDELKNGQPAREEDVTAFHNELKELMNTVNETMKQSGVKEELFALVAEGVEAQPKLAEMFEVAVKHQDSAQDLSGTKEVQMRGLNGFNELLSISPNSNMVMINFFTEPYSDEGVKKFRENLCQAAMDDLRKISTHIGRDPEAAAKDANELLSKISKEDIHYAYDEFWAAGLEERAACMQRFLNNATGDDNTRAIDICLDKYVDKENPYYGISREILTTLYKDGTRGKHYSHDKARFMIGAMLAADKPEADKDDGRQMGVGDALAKFCSSNGPAWVKFGQALSNLPMLPADIREPMSVLKDKAQSKTRWELLAEVRENMSAEGISAVRRFGKMLGAGSFWETMAVEMQDGSKQVLQMMAPGAKENAHSEFAKIVRTVEDLSGQNAQYAVLDRIVKRAKESTEVETDIVKGFDQYVGAKKNYEAFDRIEVNGVTFEMQLMPWTSFEQDEKTGNGYKMMEMADGTGLAKLDCTPEEKKVLAAGYVATELGILLGGKSWDIDRHGGQQNFDIKRGKDGKIEKVIVGIYDTGALRPSPNEEEKVMIANFYAAVIKASLKGDDVTEVMFNEVKKLEERGMDATYVSDVQRGCIAINDLVEYQKAGVDKNGSPIASQSFGQKDFLKLFGAVLASGAIDRHIADTMLEKLVTDKSVYTALAKEAIRSGVHKVKRVFGEHDTAKEDDLKIVLQTRGCLQIKDHNRRIDEENPRQSKDNVYAKSAQQTVAKRGLARKAVRNLQAFVLRRMRRDIIK